jgi:HK97 family phage prohead protease
MTDYDLLPASLVTSGAITTVLGQPSAELAALTAAVAVSYRTGFPLIPGSPPEGVGEVTAYLFQGNWIDWKCLAVDICAAASIEVPMLRFVCPSDPLVHEEPVPRDPDVSAFWLPHTEADVEADFAAAKAAGCQRTPHLTIVYALDGAAGHGGEAALRQLYDKYRGQTVLMAGVAPGEAVKELAGSYGPVIELPSLHDSVSWRDLLARITGGDRVDCSTEERELAVNGGDSSYAAELLRAPREAAGHVEPADEEVPHMLDEVRAFFAIEGDEALRAFLENGHSVSSQRLKERAKAEGISGGQFWKAAERLRRDAALTNGGPGILFGYAATVGRWREVNSSREGHFLVRHAPGAFARTIRESRHRMKVTFSHGHDAHFGFQPLGPIVTLREDQFGVFYEVALLDNDDCRQLAQGLQDGLYRSSITYDVVAENLIKKPGRSPWNPEGLPELTYTEVRLAELGPCLRPADPATSAGIR